VVCTFSALLDFYTLLLFVYTCFSSPLGEVNIAGTVTVAGQDGGGGDWCIVGHGGHGGPGGGGGGGAGSNEPGANCGAPNDVSGDGGDGFAGGGGGSTNSEQSTGNGGAGGDGTGAVGNGPPGGAGDGADGGYALLDPSQTTQGLGAPQGVSAGGDAGGGGGGGGSINI